MILKKSWRCVQGPSLVLSLRLISLHECKTCQSPDKPRKTRARYQDSRVAYSYHQAWKSTIIHIHKVLASVARDILNTISVQLTNTKARPEQDLFPPQKKLKKASDQNLRMSIAKIYNTQKDKMQSLKTIGNLTDMQTTEKV